MQSNTPTLSSFVTLRKIVLKEKRALGLKGRRRVTLRLWHALDRILLVVRRPNIYSTRATLEVIENACTVGLKRSKLMVNSGYSYSVGERTYAEQLAGRAANFTRMQWPELMDSY